MVRLFARVKHLDKRLNVPPMPLSRVRHIRYVEKYTDYAEEK